MSVGAAAARGLESGFSMGLRGAQMRTDEEERGRRRQEQDQLRTERDADRAYQRQRQEIADKRLAESDKRQSKADERQARLDSLKMLDSELGDLQTEGQGMFQTFGGFDKVPEETRAEYIARVRDTRGRRSKLRREFYEPDVEAQKQKAAETWSRIEAGQMTLEDVPDDELAQTLTVQTRRPLTDFVRQQPDMPSPVEQAAMDVEAGLQTGNQSLLVKGANILLRPELSTGIGTDGPDGNEIVDKQLVELVPHPQQPGLFVPIVEVTVKRDDGALGKYRAPVTEGRGVYANDPNQMPKAISVQDAMDRVGQLGSLAKFVNQPEVRERLDRASPKAKASSEEFLQALGSIGVSAPKPGKISRERVDLGGHIVEREVDERGQIISERKLAKGLAPSRGEGPTSGARDDARMDRQLREAVDTGLITQEEATKRRRDRLLGLDKPTQSNKPLTEGQAKANLFGKRMMAAEEIIQRVGTDYSAMGINTKMAAEDLPLVGGLAGVAGNAMLSDNSQAIEQAQRDFINAVLRRESGAVIANSEFNNGRKQYFPQPGDSESTILQKAANRQKAIEGILDELPPDRRPQPTNSKAGSVSGSWADLPTTNGQGWTLMTDAEGNKAYVSPDGQQFEEAR